MHKPAEPTAIEHFEYREYSDDYVLKLCARATTTISDSIIFAPLAENT